MSWILQFLMCLFGILITIFLENAQAGRLQAEAIIGGHDANTNQFPYQVVLFAHSVNFCGGSILSELFVITAAHCVTKKDGSFKNYPIKVIGGINDLNSDIKVEVDVIRIYVPSEYDPTTSHKYETGDIAILKLRKGLDIKDNPILKKIQLPKKDVSYDEVETTVSGFGWNKIKMIRDPLLGLTENGGISYGKMRYAKANVINHENCQNLYRLVKISTKHICARVVQHDKKKPEGVCSGDSGGPLIYEGVQIGVLSNNPYGCREDVRPAIYTRVSEFLDFVNKAVNGTTDNSIRSTDLMICV